MLLTNWKGSYEELCADFRWKIPTHFNMARATCGNPKFSDSIALIFVSRKGVKLTYRFSDMDALSNRLANVFKGLGVVKGERVSIFLPQRPEVPVVHLACWKIGAVSLPLTTLFGPDALLQRVGDASPRLVVCEEEDLERIRGIGDELGIDLQYLVVRVEESRSRLPDDCYDFWSAVAEASDQIRSAVTASEDPAFLSFTSGTTGAAKGALHCHRTLLGHLTGFQLSHSLFPQPGDLSWTPADWAWMGGFMDVLFPSWCFGVPVLATPRKFDPEWAWRICEEFGVRNTFLPPTAVRLMRQAWSPGLGAGVKLRSVASGGETLGAEILEWAREVLGLTINEFYGQTEVNLVIGNCEVLFDPVAGSMGKTYVGHKVAILDDDGVERPSGEAGEIAIAIDDPTAFLGYWKRPKATEEKLRGGWIYTGDVGVQDDRGFFWYEARRDDVIISSGYRIGPSEIEDCIMRHPAVRLAAVVGSPDEIRGEIVKAFIELRPDIQSSPVLEEEIQAMVRKRLATYLYPREIEFIDQIPLTTTGKVKRSDLRARERNRIPPRTPDSLPSGLMRNPSDRASDAD